MSAKRETKEHAEGEVRAAPSDDGYIAISAAFSWMRLKVEERPMKTLASLTFETASGPNGRPPGGVSS